jgi:diguanylate cyclase (GGDEF)-like protein
MLTGLTNRPSVAALRAQVDRCRRYGPDGALHLVSLDAFQKVNDTFGHAAGDALLIDLAGMLRDHLRAADVVARLGGDEFAVLLPRTNRSGALELAKHIRLLVRTRITSPDGAHPVSASIGVVVIDGDDAEQLLLRRAGRSRGQAGRLRVSLPGDLLSRTAQAVP